MRTCPLALQTGIIYKYFFSVCGQLRVCSSSSQSWCCPRQQFINVMRQVAGDPWHDSQRVDCCAHRSLRRSCSQGVLHSGVSIGCLWRRKAIIMVFVDRRPWLSGLAHLLPGGSPRSPFCFANETLVARQSRLSTRGQSSTKRGYTLQKKVLLAPRRRDTDKSERPIRKMPAAREMNTSYRALAARKCRCYCLCFLALLFLVMEKCRTADVAAVPVVVAEGGRKIPPADIIKTGSKDRTIRHPKAPPPPRPEDVPLHSTLVNIQLEQGEWSVIVRKDTPNSEASLLSSTVCALETSPRRRW